LILNLACLQKALE